MQKRKVIRCNKCACFLGNSKRVPFCDDCRPPIVFKIYVSGRSEPIRVAVSWKDAGGRPFDFFYTEVARELQIAPERFKGFGKGGMICAAEYRHAKHRRFHFELTEDK